jgi:hypothetical protein
VEGGCCRPQRLDDDIGDRGSPVKGDERLGLGGDLVAHEPTGDSIAELGVERPGLGSAKTRSVAALRPERREDPAISVDLEIARANIGEPADRLQGDRPGMTEDDEPTEPPSRPVDQGLTSVSADPVADAELTAKDADIEAVAGQD